MKLTGKEQWMLHYIQEISSGEFVSPTRVGAKYGAEVLRNYNCHSSTASPTLLKLTALGYLERNNRGWYKPILKA
jgi:hypothetical protein